MVVFATINLTVDTGWVVIKSLVLLLLSDIEFIGDLKKKAIKAAEEVGIPVKQTTKAEKILKKVKSFMQENVSFGASYCGGVLVGFSI